MADWQMKIFAVEADRLIDLSAEDAVLRAELRALAEKILAATANAADVNGKAQANSPSAATVDATIEARSSPPAAQVESVRRPEPLRELTLGRSVPARREAKPGSTRPAGPAAFEDEIETIEARCRKKADAARWAAAHERWLEQGAELDDEGPSPDPEITRWADTLMNGLLWQTAADPAASVDISVLDDLGGCFEVVAEAMALVRGILDEKKAIPKALEEVLPLVSEAQSALRAAIRRIQAVDDADQIQVFDWLKAMAARYHVFIKRFMRADDPADPVRWADLLSRIERQRNRYGQTGRGPQHEASFNRLRSLLDEVPEGRRGGQDWPAVIEVVEDLIGKGLPPSNREIRDLLLPVIDEIPETMEMPPGFRRVLREIDRFLATHSGGLPAAAAATPEPTAEVKEAARLLAGKSVVLIGGSRRRGTQEALKKALALKDLIWLETKEHQSVATFEAVVARTDVALILLAIRWSSHSFGDVKQLGERHGKPLVRLPGGYSPNQVAAQIVAQCSGQLEVES